MRYCRTTRQMRRLWRRQRDGRRLRKDGWRNTELAIALYWIESQLTIHQLSYIDTRIRHWHAHVSTFDEGIYRPNSRVESTCFITNEDPEARSLWWPLLPLELPISSVDPTIHSTNEPLNHQVIVNQKSGWFHHLDSIQVTNKRLHQAVIRLSNSFAFHLGFRCRFVPIGKRWKERRMKQVRLYWWWPIRNCEAAVEDKISGACTHD